jgi:hypothetical protein
MRLKMRFMIAFTCVEPEQPEKQLGRLDEKPGQPWWRPFGLAWQQKQCGQLGIHEQQMLHEKQPWRLA